MNKLFFVWIWVSVFTFGQAPKKYDAEILAFQKQLNDEYKNPKESPLRGKNFEEFKGHPFFPIQERYKVQAKLIKTKGALPFSLPTSSGNDKEYVEYGKIRFVLKGKTYELAVHQSLHLMKQEKYKNYLFLMFRDETNGKETYGGGRYLDLEIPKGEEIIVDFNKAYQPFCAYNAYDYSCPIVPKENFIPLKIKAGVKYSGHYDH